MLEIQHWKSTELLLVNKKLVCIFAIISFSKITKTGLQWIN